MELTSATLPGIALTLIHTGRAPTRSALTSQLGVTRATTGAITGELRDLGLIVVDAGPGRGGGQQGRPSHRLLPDPSGPVALAAQVHPDGFEVALVGLGGTVVARHAENGPVPADPGRALAPVAEAAAALLARVGPPVRRRRRRGADRRHPPRGHGGARALRRLARRRAGPRHLRRGARPPRRARPDGRPGWLRRRQRRQRARARRAPARRRPRRHAPARRVGRAPRCRRRARASAARCTRAAAASPWRRAT